VVADAGAFDTSLKFGADLDLWLRVLARGTGAMSPVPVMDYHLHDGQVTQDRGAMARSQLEVLRRYAGDAPWPRLLIEGWRGGACWDRLRTQLRARDMPGALRAGAMIAGHPARVVGLGGILYRRARMRRRTVEIERGR
jgi:hypothetical protein